MDAAQDHLDDLVAAVAHVRSCIARSPDREDMVQSLGYLLRMEAAWHEKFALSTSVAPSNDDTLTLWFSNWAACWQTHKPMHDWRTKTAMLVIPMPQDDTLPGISEKTGSAQSLQHALVRGSAILLVLLVTLLSLGHASYRRGLEA